MNLPEARALAGLTQRPPVRALLERLSPLGEEARLVGGAIRNVLMGLPVSDIDIAATMLPAEVMKVAAPAGWKAIPTGIEHGTVTIVIGDEAFEVTTLREDIETDGRRAIVRFGRSFEHDAARRDFTINALSLSLDGRLHDYFGGLADIAARRVRFIGDPAQRLAEDYLRALRFLRFSASYGDGRLDEEGFAAVLGCRAGLSGLSGERVRQELLKLLETRHGSRVVSAAEESHHLLSGLLGPPLRPDRLAQLLDAAVSGGVDRPPAIVALFALAVAGEADIARLKERLRLANREAADMEGLLAALGLRRAGACLDELCYRAPEAALWAALLDGVERAVSVAELRRIVADWRLAAQAGHRFLVTGDDVIARGVTPGAAVGAILRAAELRWIQAGFPAGRAAQLALLDAELPAP